MSEYPYFDPTSLNQALDDIQSCSEKITFLAGGTDLFRKMKKGLFSPSALMNINNIPELQTIEYTQEKGLKIGAAVKVNTIEHSEIISKHFPILNQIAYRFGTFQVRSMGTIGGNICNASPAADFASVLLALDAQLVIYSPEKTRVIPISDFFINTGETALLNKEFLGEILIPPQTPTSDVAILRHSTREMLDVSVLSVCIWMDFDKKLCQSVRIGLGSVAPTPVRAYSAEQVLIGKPLTDEVIQSCIDCAQNDVAPISDFRSSAQYRRAMMAEYIRRILANWS